jgi:LacI family transcriptional regulator
MDVSVAPPHGRRMSGIRISDVAARAGVSAMTVSRVMNNRGAVKPGTREAVLRAVEALGYAPNAAARSLALGGLDRIGLVWSNPSAGYLSEFLLGALEGVRAHGGQLIVEQCDDGADSEVAAVRRLAAGGRRGCCCPRRMANRSPPSPRPRKWV